MNNGDGQQCRVRTSDTIKFDLYVLRDTYGYSWRQIACFSPYDEIGIPAGTLASIYKTGGVPKRWCKRLGILRHKPRPRRAINLADAHSAAETIRRHGGVEFAMEVARLLEE